MKQKTADCHNVGSKDTIGTFVSVAVEGTAADGAPWPVDTGVLPKKDATALASVLLVGLIHFTEPFP